MLLLLLLAVLLVMVLFDVEVSLFARLLVVVMLVWGQ